MNRAARIFVAALSSWMLTASCSSSSGDGAPAATGGKSGAGGSVAFGGTGGVAAWDAGGKGGVYEPDGGDAAPDADAHPAIPVLDCLGETAPLQLSDGMPYTDVTLGDPPSTKPFLLDFASTTSGVDFAAFAAPVPAASNCDPTQLGQACGFASFDFFGPWGPVTLFTADYSLVKGTLRQAGIVGTDFLSIAIYSLDYAHGLVHHAKDQASLCSVQELAAAGLSPLSSAGFYSNDLTNLKPLSDVMAGAAANLTVPDVPTVPLRIGGVTAEAQLDTGFDDSVTPYAVNVNQAFFDALSQAAPGALLRDTKKDVQLTTCTNIDEPAEAYDISPSLVVELIDSSFVGVRRYTNATLYVKKPPAPVLVCGGIGTWTVPAAQLGASFFADAGSVVFDPFGSTVWWPRD